MYTWGRLCVCVLYNILNNLPLKYNFKNTLDLNKTPFWDATKC